jgi:hypothetical protein
MLIVLDGGLFSWCCFVCFLLCGYFDTVVVGCCVEVVVELVVERGSAGEVYIL